VLTAALELSLIVLAKAKFQFQLCQPFESPFAQDFDTVIQVLEGIQGKIAQTGDRRNMIVSDMNSAYVCACLAQHPANTVTQKQRIPKHAVYLADLESVNAGHDGRVPDYKQ
jgi:hypothetical protein